MSWYRSILLLSVLGMTWSECDRHPLAHSRAVPDALLDSAPTNTLALPGASRTRAMSRTAGSASLRLARMAGQGR
jgi:hypothetical protein